MPDETNCRFTTDQSQSHGESQEPPVFETVHDDILITKLQTKQVVIDKT